MNDNSQDPNKKNYFNPVTHFEKEKLYSDLRDKKIEITLWLQKDEDNAESFSCSGVQKDLTIKLEKNEPLFSKPKDSNLSGKNILFKFSIRSNSYFGNGKVSRDKGNPSLILDKIFLHKKRKDFRLEACKAIEIQFKIDDEVLNALDISAGGICLIADKKEKERFKKGTKFTECKLKINRERFDIPRVKILSTTSFHNSKKQEKLKVAIQFVSLPESVDIRLSKLIHIEARGLILAREF